jgi:hypothetical protein
MDTAISHVRGTFDPGRHLIWVEAGPADQVSRPAAVSA